jgi:protein TonB
MVHAFVSSQPLRLRSLGEVAVSFVAHGGLIAVAVSTSGLPPRPVGISPRIAGEYVMFVTSTRSSAMRATRRAERQPVKRELVDAPLLRDLAAIHFAVDQAAVVPNVDVDVNAEIPAVTYNAMMGSESTESTVSFARSVLGRAASLKKGPYDAYDEYVVERQVFVKRGNPKPEYPNNLRRNGVEASFMVQFVVDSTGHVDPAAIEFLEPAQQPFLESVRRALRRSYYFAAELDGRPVRQLVRQRFIFRIER